MLQVLVIIGVFAFIAAVYALAGCAFGFFWNLLAPAVWAAAPHLGWKAAASLGLIVGIAQALFVGRSSKS